MFLTADARARPEATLNGLQPLIKNRHGGGRGAVCPSPGKASFLLFRNDALKLAHLLAEAEQNNAILRLDDGLAGRDERLAAPDDPEQKYPLGQAKLIHTLPGDKGN